METFSEQHYPHGTTDMDSEDISGSEYSLNEEYFASHGSEGEEDEVVFVEDDMDDELVVNVPDFVNNNNNNNNAVHGATEETRHRNITAADVAAGVDIQGIPWATLLQPRAYYRAARLKDYNNYVNLQNHSLDQIKKEQKEYTTDGQYYAFRYNARNNHCTVCHFQLRNLVWATSKHDVYFMHNYRILHYSPIEGSAKCVLDLQGKLDREHRVQISCMTAKDDILVCGGFYGEVVCKNLRTQTMLHNSRITHDENAITNAVEIYTSRSGGKQLVASNNDSNVRIFDVPSFVCLDRYTYPWPVNHTSVSPDGKLLCVVGDNTDAIIADQQTGKVALTLQGHVDYSFASAWHPYDNVTVATGNQDRTTRVWDIRYPSTAVAVLVGKIGAVRSLRYSSSGEFLAAAECADFVTVFETAQQYERAQQIDIFGEISGISFSPDTNSLWIGNSERTYGSLLEFERIHYTRISSLFL